MTSKDIYASLLEYVDQSNKYYRTYIDLCSRAASRGSRKNAKSILGYVEGHHIVPRSYNEELRREKNNIVYMTFREHFIAHKLLIKISNDEHVHKAKLAITMFRQKNKLNQKVLSSRDFEYIRKIAIEAFTGELHPLYGKPGTLLGKICYTNGSVDIYIDKDEEPPEGFYKGTKLKSYVTYTNGTENCKLPPHEKPPEGFYRGSKTKSRVVYTNGIESCMLLPNEEPPEGFYKGSKTKSRVVYTNGIEDRRLPPHEKPPEGFYRGSKTKSHVTYTNGIENCILPPNEKPPEGFYKGSKTKSYIRYTNGIEECLLPPNEDIPDGWYRGKTYPQKFIDGFLKYNGFKSLDEFKNVLTECISSGMTLSQLSKKFPKAKHFCRSHPTIVKFLTMFDLHDKVRRDKPGPKRKNLST